MRRFGSVILVGATFAVFGVRPTVGQEAKAAEAANATLMRFWSKLDAKDLDGLLKTVETPFCFNVGNPDKIVENVITERDDVKKLMKELVGEQKGERPQLTVVSTQTYPAFLKQTGDLLKIDGTLKKDRQALDEVLKKEGFVILAKISEGKSKESFPVGFLVASPNGEAKIVGILVGLASPKKE